MQKFGNGHVNVPVIIGSVLILLPGLAAQQICSYCYDHQETLAARTNQLCPSKLKKHMKAVKCSAFDSKTAFTSTLPVAEATCTTQAPDAEM